MQFSLENIYKHVVFDVNTLFYSEKRYQQPGENVLPNQKVHLACLEAKKSTYFVFSEKFGRNSVWSWVCFHFDFGLVKLQLDAC